MTTVVVETHHLTDPRAELLVDLLDQGALKQSVSHRSLCYTAVHALPETASVTLQVVLPISAHGP